MKLHGAFLACLICGALGASVPSEEPKQGYLEKLINYRKSLLEFNWKIDESKYHLNENLRGLLKNSDNVDIPAIEDKLQNLRFVYAKQIAEYRDALNSLYNIDLEPQLQFGEDHKQNIEAYLKKAEANFNNGLNELTSSLEKLKPGSIKVKADGDSDTSQSWWMSLYNTVISYFPDISNSGYFEFIQDTVNHLANNVTTYLNQNQGIQLILPGASSNSSPGSGSSSPSSGSSNPGSGNSSPDHSPSESSNYSDLPIPKRR